MSLKHVLLQGREKIPGKDNEAMKGLKLEKYESLFPRVYRTKGVVHMDILENLAAIRDYFYFMHRMHRSKLVRAI